MENIAVIDGQAAEDVALKSGFDPKKFFGRSRNSEKKRDQVRDRLSQLVPSL